MNPYRNSKPQTGSIYPRLRRRHLTVYDRLGAILDGACTAQALGYDTLVDAVAAGAMPDPILELECRE